MNVREGVGRCMGPFVQDGLAALGGWVEWLVMVMVITAVGLAGIGVAAGMASLAGGDVEMDGEVTERSKSIRREIPKWLEGAPSSIVDEEAVGGVDVG